MPFKTIHHIDDVLPAVVDKKEIKFWKQPNGVTVGAYVFSDSHTFDTPEALECRGIAFGPDGRIVSRTMQKFFNLGEKAHLSKEAIAGRTDIAAIYEKLDGSMIATAWVNGDLQLRSMRAFHSDVVKLSHKYLARPQNKGTLQFMNQVAAAGMTAIFELTHPKARIVVAYDEPGLRLLHVRDNITGQYVLLDPHHKIHALIKQFQVPRVATYEMMTFEEMLGTLENMKEKEGYVVQFKDGSMLKVKCPWYQRLHKVITFLREREIATMALAGELDDVKSALVEAGIDLTAIEEIESRVKNLVIGISEEVDSIITADARMERKDFVEKHKQNPVFALLMERYSGHEPDIIKWVERKHLKQDFSLQVLVNDAIAEEFGMQAPSPLPRQKAA